MIKQAAIDDLRRRARAGDTEVLKGAEFKSLYDELKTLPDKEKPSFGKVINDLKDELTVLLEANKSDESEELTPIDVTAPWDVNSQEPQLLPSNNGSIHPINKEIQRIVGIFESMGFTSVESRQIDNDYNMFSSLNFPEDHPARDDYDTFATEDGLIAPAHTSTMQNRILSAGKDQLQKGRPIACVIPGRVYRNEDVDVTHEHTFHQLEGIYVDKGVNVGMLIATLKAYLSEYFEEDLEVKLQPFYFPFTEPSFELAVERPESLRKDDSEEQKWLELLGCGMIHPYVLREAGIDPKIYSGFAWGQGIERMVMMKEGIEDVRHFHSGKLDFLRQFK